LTTLPAVTGDASAPAATDIESVEVTVDPTQPLRNNFLLRVTDALSGYLTNVVNNVSTINTTIFGPGGIDAPGGGIQEQVNTNTSDISTNTSNISQNTSDIADNTSAIQNSVAELGFINMFFGTVAPTGWLIANGTTLGSTASAAANNDDSYEALWKHIYDSTSDTDHPVSGGRTTRDADWTANKTITLPNYSGRTPFGFDSGDADFNALGKAGGAKERTLAAANLPEHTHDAGTHTHGFDAPVLVPNDIVVQSGAGTTVTEVGSWNPTQDSKLTDAASGDTSGITGGTTNDPVDIKNPYSVVNFIIKY
jgi:microcystin-dependent protein